MKTNKTSRKKATIALLGTVGAVALFTGVLTANGAPYQASAEEGTFTNTQTVSCEPANMESYITNSYNVGINRAFKLSKTQPFSITVSATESTTAADWRAVLEFTSKGGYDDVNANVTKKADIPDDSVGISIAYRAGGSYGTRLRVAGWGDGTWAAKEMLLGPSNQIAPASGEKFVLSLEWEGDDLWLKYNGSKVYAFESAGGANDKNVLSLLDTKYTSWMEDGADIFIGTGTWRNDNNAIPRYNIYSVNSEGKTYSARELIQMDKIGEKWNGTNTDGDNCVTVHSENAAGTVFTSIPLDTTKRIDLTLKNSAQNLGFAFTTQPSNGGSFIRGESGTGFACINTAYAGMKFDFYNVNQTLTGGVIKAYRTNDENVDGLYGKIGDLGKLTFSIVPNGESFDFYANGVKMTNGTAAVADDTGLYDAIKGSLTGSFTENGVTYLSIGPVNGTFTGDTMIYSLKNGEKEYTFSELISASSKPISAILGDQFQGATGKGEYTEALSASLRLDMAASGLTTDGHKTLTFSGGEHSTTVTLGYDGTHVTASLNGGTAVSTDAALGGHLLLKTSLVAGQGVFTINGVEIGRANLTDYATAQYETNLSYGADADKGTLILFGATSVIENYTASVVVKANGVGLEGASVVIKQNGVAIGDALTTNASGAVTIENLHGDYTVEVTKAGYEFAPASLTVYDDTASIEVNAQTYTGTISVKVGEVAISGATVTPSISDLSVTDNGDGTYSFGSYAGAYTVTVAKEGYDFGTAVTIGNATSVTVQGTYSVEITVKIGLVVADEATVVLKQTGKDDVTATYENGVYKASGLVGEYTVSVTQEGYTFDSKTVSATQRTASVSGTKNAVVIPPEKDPNEDKKGGCAGTVEGSVAFLAAGLLMATVATIVVAKKKKDE